VHTTTPAAYASLWSYLAGIDLLPTVTRRHAPLDDPLEEMLADPTLLTGNREFLEAVVTGRVRL
jgi:hypothetical protein